MSAGDDDDAELRDSLIEALESNGTLGKIRAQLRASVFLALEEREKVKNKTPLRNQKAQDFWMTREGPLCVGLLQDLFGHMGFGSTASVFRCEAAAPVELTREQVAIDLGLRNVALGEPLLSALIRDRLNTAKSPRQTGSVGVTTAINATHHGAHLFNPLVAPGSGGGLFGKRPETPETRPSAAPIAPPLTTDDASSSGDEDFFDKPPQKQLTDSLHAKLNLNASVNSSVGSPPLTKPPSLFDKASSSNQSAKASVAGTESGSGRAGLSFLGDLPDLTNKKPSLPPLGLNVGASQQNSKSYMKLFGDTVDNDEGSPDSSVSDSLPQKDYIAGLFPSSSDKNRESANVNGLRTNTPEKTKVPPQQPLGASKTQAEPPRSRGLSADDSVSEDIAEEIENDDLLKSDSERAQLSF